eukprot:363916-Chlamydomonas_euryale.AAC.5
MPRAGPVRRLCVPPWARPALSVPHAPPPRWQGSRSRRRSRADGSGPRLTQPPSAPNQNSSQPDALDECGCPDKLACHPTSQPRLLVGGGGVSKRAVVSSHSPLQLPVRRRRGVQTSCCVIPLANSAACRGWKGVWTGFRVIPTCRPRDVPWSSAPPATCLVRLCGQGLKNLDLKGVRLAPVAPRAAFEGRPLPYLVCQQLKNWRDDVLQPEAAVTVQRQILRQWQRALVNAAGPKARARGGGCRSVRAHALSRALSAAVVAPLVLKVAEVDLREPRFSD